MKDKIMLFIIGVLVGAVIATGTFYVYTTMNTNCNNNNQVMNNGTPPEMPNGQNNGNGTPPEMPSNNNNNQTNNY